jgi:hypothetical protein
MNIMNFIYTLKRLSLPPVKTPLGRWNINNYRETILKIKYANEDNCFTSYSNHRNINIQSIERIQNNNINNDDDEYIYMMGYESVHK